MRTDGHDEANSHFSHFCERTYKRKVRVLNQEAKHKVAPYMTWKLFSQFM